MNISRRGLSGVYEEDDESIVLQLSSSDGGVVGGAEALRSEVDGNRHHRHHPILPTPTHQPFPFPLTVSPTRWWSGWVSWCHWDIQWSVAIIIIIIIIISTRHITSITVCSVQ